MIPEPCKYTPDVSFVNVTFFNISAFVNSWKRCQPCFNGAQKRTAFKEMAHHCNSQNYKCCQKATFLLYWLAPGNTVLHIVPSYMPLSADDVSLHTSNAEMGGELPGLHWERRRALRPGEPHVSPQPLWWPRGGGRRAVGADTPTAMVTTQCHKNVFTTPELGREQSSPSPQVLMQFEAMIELPAARAAAAWSSLVAEVTQPQTEVSPIRDLSMSTGWIQV